MWICTEIGETRLRIPASHLGLAVAADRLETSLYHFHIRDCSSIRVEGKSLWLSGVRPNREALSFDGKQEQTSSPRQR
jgi:hypothetical protein